MITVVYTLHATHLEFFVSYSWITFRMVDGCGLRPASLTSFSIAVRNWVIIENSKSYCQQFSSPVDDKLLRKKKERLGLRFYNKLPCHSQSWASRLQETDQTRFHWTEADPVTSVWLHSCLSWTEGESDESQNSDKWKMNFFRRVVTKGLVVQKLIWESTGLGCSKGASDNPGLKI